MSNWKQTHEIRIEASRKDVEKSVAKINAELLNLPPRFKLTVNENGRDLRLTEGQDPL